MSKRQRRRLAKQRRHYRPRPGKRQLAAGAGLAIGASLAAGGTAQAEDFTVTNLDPNGPGSLFQAITDANNAATDDRILFQSGLSGTITPGIGLQIADAVQVLGPGPGQIAVSGGGSARIFDVSLTSDPVTISGLTLTNGTAAYGTNTSNSGGAIFSSTRLTVSNSVLSGNTASSAGGGFGEGGAIFVYDGSLQLDSSTVSDNTAFNAGGGIQFFDSEDDVQSTIRNSTISGNTVNGGFSDGGAIYLSHKYNQGPLVIQSSTLVGNDVPTGNTGSRGGAIYDRAPNGPLTTVVSSTITGNSAGAGGGIFQGYGQTLQNTIVANNTATNGGPDLLDNGVPFDTAFSLIGNTADATISATGPNLLGVDPQLGPLQNNGGPTQTQALAATSPAVDAGSAFGLTSDQRGVLRPIDFPAIPNAAGGDGTDIGAFELQPSNDISLGRLKKNRKKGTATLSVNVPLPDAGTLTLSGKGLKTRSKAVADTGIVKLKVIGKRKVKKALRRKGRRKVKINVTYSPTGADAATESRRAKLIKKLKRR